MFAILRGTHARFERDGRPASADDTCCPCAAAEILRGPCAADFWRRLRPLRSGRALCALLGEHPGSVRAFPTPQVPTSAPKAHQHRTPCRIRLRRRLALRASGMPFCAFVCRAARTHSPGGGLPVRRSPSEHCRRPGRRVLLAARQTRAHRRASDCGRRREMLSRRCSGDLGRALPDAERSLNFPVFPERWRKRHAANESHPLPGRGNGRSAEDPVFRTPDIYAKASAFVRISPCAWRRAPVPWWR